MTGGERSVVGLRARQRVVCLCGVFLLVALFGCERDAEHRPPSMRPAGEAGATGVAAHPGAEPPPAGSVDASLAPSAAAPGGSARAASARAPAPATVEQVPVAGDLPASFVRGAPGTEYHIVFLPGLCSNANAYLFSFPEAARRHGGVVTIDGDRPCGAASSGFRSFTWNAELQRRRIEAAMAAVGVEPPSRGLTLVGYSSGASIAELMHEQWPSRFPRLVLIAPPKDPSVARLWKARAVVNMCCSLDVTTRMKRATTRLRGARVESLYLEMPGCTHGNIADGELLFGRAFDWLDEVEALGAEWEPSH